MEPRPTPQECSSGERMAELMAWHGMARYADPDDLAAHLCPVPRPAVDRATGGPEEPVRE